MAHGDLLPLERRYRGEFYAADPGGVNATTENTETLAAENTEHTEQTGSLAAENTETLATENTEHTDSLAAENTETLATENTEHTDSRAAEHTVHHAMEDWAHEAQERTTLASQPCRNTAVFDW